MEENNTYSASLYAFVSYSVQVPLTKCRMKQDHAQGLLDFYGVKQAMKIIPELNFLHEHINIPRMKMPGFQEFQQMAGKYKH